MTKKIKDIEFVKEIRYNNFNTIYQDSKKIDIEIYNIDSVYINAENNFGICIEVENLNIFLTFDAKELLSCLNKKTINELKEKLKAQIDNL